MTEALQRVTDLADAVAAQQMTQPVAQWHWGPALQGLAYARLQEHHGDERYTGLLLRYARHHAHPPGPRIDASDTAAPGLVTFELERLGHTEFAWLTDAVITYLRRAPRAVGEAVNHLGDGAWSRLYPRSVWVDTLMMFGVFPARVGTARGDAELVDLAAALPAHLAELLQHPSGLWTHSYWAPSWHSRSGRRFPRRSFWARGNGWVVASLPMILTEIGEHERSAEIRDLLVRTSAAMLQCQSADGSWTTLLNGPSRGRPETSATALVAAGWFTAVARGWLPESYLVPAEQALKYVVSRINPHAPGGTSPIRRWLSRTAAASTTGAYQGPVLEGISGPTIPLPLIPRLGYTRLTPDAPNASYGMAAAIFAALAEAELKAG